MRTVPDLTDNMPFSPITPEHTAQEAALRQVLDTLEFESALEVGCGLARITSLLAGMVDDLTAIDIGSDQVAVTRKRVPEAIVMQSSIQDFETERTWDLVLASEVLMHIPPSEIQAVCDKLRKLANRWVVTIDWTRAISKPIAPWNWRHDYRKLFDTVEGEIPTGLQSIFVIRA